MGRYQTKNYCMHYKKKKSILKFDMQNTVCSVAIHCWLVFFLIKFVEMLKCTEIVKLKAILITCKKMKTVNIYI